MYDLLLSRFRFRYPLLHLPSTGVKKSLTISRKHLCRNDITFKDLVSAISLEMRRLISKSSLYLRKRFFVGYLSSFSVVCRFSSGEDVSVNAVIILRNRGTISSDGRSPEKGIVAQLWEILWSSIWMLNWKSEIYVNLGLEKFHKNIASTVVLICNYVCLLHYFYDS